MKPLRSVDYRTHFSLDSLPPLKRTFILRGSGRCPRPYLVAVLRFGQHLSMHSTPPPRAPRPRSPVEDGEIGETAQDVLIRHPLLTPNERRIVLALREHEDELTPEAAAAMGRMLSAALSPMPVKASPTTAKMALNIMATKMLPQRRNRRAELVGCCG